jgi:hypothetical protein
VGAEAEQAKIFQHDAGSEHGLRHLEGIQDHQHDVDDLLFDRRWIPRSVQRMRSSQTQHLTDDHPLAGRPISQGWRVNTHRLSIDALDDDYYRLVSLVPKIIRLIEQFSLSDQSGDADRLPPGAGPRQPDQQRGQHERPQLGAVVCRC